MDRSVSRRRWATPCSCLVTLLLLSLLCLIPLTLIARNRLTVVGKHVGDASTWTRTYDGYYWDTNASQIVTEDWAARPTLRLDDKTGRTIAAAAVVPDAKLGVRPSPDGKWLLLRARGNASFTAVETRTRQVIKWKAAPRSLIYSLWFPDSRRWVEFEQTADGKGSRPIIHSLEGPDRRMALIADTFIWPVGTAPDSHVLNARNDDHLELWEYDVAGDVRVPQKHRIALPANASIYEVEGSPDGKQVAYLVQEKTTSFITRLLDRILPTRKDPSQNYMSLWVSRADGSELHRIGFERVSEAAGVQWSPDGKRLSLFLDKGLYVVPAD